MCHMRGSVTIRVSRERMVSGDKCWQRPMWLLVSGLLFGCSAVGAQNSAAGSNAAPASDNNRPAFEQPIDLIPEALGPYSWKITTGSDVAQAYFTQGMQLRYAFNVGEAARSMAEARRIDPECAICYWGEAFALGSFLNGPMTVEKGAYAHAAISKAVELSATHASELERDLIAAAVVRYPEDFDPANRRAVDAAFAVEMAELYAKYPRHQEVATVYAVALFTLEERRGYRDLNDPDLQRLHEVLLSVLDQDLAHPGACHLYIHATESSQRPELALECAVLLGSAIPVASHIQHMPSHTYNVVGLWGRSVRANTFAWQSDQKARHNEGFSYGPQHNLHMLLFAASYDGQGAVATQAGKDYRKVTDNAMYEVLTLIRFGRFDEVGENDRRPASEVPAAVFDFAQGYASLKQGDVETAAELRSSVLAFAAATDGRFRFHPASQVIGTLGQLLDGEIRWSRGDLDGAIVAFEEAVRTEDLLDYDEPEPLPFAARHWLGAALLEAGRYADAETVYRAELLEHPHNGWSLFGLDAALAGQGVNDASVKQDFEQSWARSDTWITSSRF
jgi:tetratricopeptide (TPR) repeat protein